MRIGHFTPTYTPICDEQHVQVLREKDTLQDRLMFDYRRWTANASDIVILRNRALAYAIEMECDYLCMQDSDIFSKHPMGAIAPLLETAVKTGAAMVAAICGMRKAGAPANVEPCRPGEVYEAERVGTGLVVIDCKMASKIVGMAFAKIYDVDGTNIRTGEDVWFCERLQELGAKIFVDGRVPTTHINRDVLTLDFPGAATVSSKSQTSNPTEKGAHTT